MKQVLLFFVIYANLIFAQGSGSFDPSFNNGNAVGIYFSGGSPNELRDMKVQSDNKIVVCGWSRGLYPDRPFTLARINEDGMPDTSFGVNGNVLFNVANTGWNHPEALEILADGKILVMGNIASSSGDIIGYYAFARLNPDGSLDSTFGINGIQEFQNQNTFATGYLYDMMLDTNGQILVAGWHSTGNYKGILLKRFHNDGTPDQSFGNGGEVILNDNTDVIATNILQQSDGKILVLGKYTPGSYYNLICVRLNEDGSIDATYGQNGWTTCLLRLGLNSDDFFKGRLQGDDKLVVAGERYDIGTEDNFMSMRFTTSGNIDSSYGTNGLVNVDLRNLGLQEYGQQILIGDNGTILIGGQAYDSNNFSHFTILSTSPAGQIDTTFGSGGIAQMLGGYKMRAIVFDNSGRIVVGGQSTQTGGYWVGRFLYGSTTSIADEPTPFIQKFTLEQNYPNPFNPGTTIQFGVAGSGHVSLKVFDSLGKRVATLVDAPLTAGSYTAYFDAAGLPSGVYFYQLQTRQMTQTRKMVLMR